MHAMYKAPRHDSFNTAVRESAARQDPSLLRAASFQANVVDNAARPSPSPQRAAASGILGGRHADDRWAIDTNRSLDSWDRAARLSPQRSVGSSFFGGRRTGDRWARDTNTSLDTWDRAARHLPQHRSPASTTMSRPSVVRFAPDVGKAADPVPRTPLLPPNLPPERSALRDDPGGNTRDRWRVDPNRQTAWTWTCRPELNKLSHNLVAAPPGRTGNAASRLKEQADDVRLSAAIEVARLRTMAAEHIAGLLRSESVRNRRSAAHCLAFLGPAAGPHIPILVKSLQDNDAEVVNTAISALGLIGAPAAARAMELLKRLDFLDERVKDDAVHSLSQAQAASTKLGKSQSEPAFHFTLAQGLRPPPKRPPGMPAGYLEDKLRHVKKQLTEKNVDPLVRREACRYIRLAEPEIVPMPPWEVAGILFRLIEGPHDGVREEATHTLAHMGVAAGEHLARYLGSAEASVRERAIQALCDMGEAAGPHVDAISKCLKDPDADIRASATRLLGLIGKHSKRHEPEFVQGLKDPEDIVKMSSRYAISQVMQPREGPRARSWRTKLSA